MIDCHVAERRMHRYVDRELSAGETEEVRLHLQVCDNCRSRFRFEEGLRRLVRRAGSDDPVPESLRQSVRSLVRREPRR
ncbi:MAG: anti-sigma factor family protein [Chloroflexota bacterium]